MLQAMFSGVSGLQVHQTKLDVIGNNIANINTIGFKSGRVTFEDQLSQTIRDAAGSTDNVGGQNPAQVGLGVALGAVDTLQTQGNLQSTGNLTDMAIQGNGFFLVGSGKDISYTRDGSFNLDGDGILVNPATGEKLLGYVADKSGNIDTTQQVTDTSVLKIPIGSLTSVKQTSAATFQGNLNASADLQSTKSTFSGNVLADPTTINATTYDALGNAHTVAVTLDTKTSAAGSDTWNASLQLDGTTVPGGPYNMVFNTATGAFTSTTLPGSATVSGTGSAANFPVTLNFAGLTGLASGAANAVGASDGQTGISPNWPATIKVYDSLGISHLLDFKFTRSLVTNTAPASTAGQWSWTASENGNQVASSSGVGNKPLYFDNKGNLTNTALQTLSLSPPQPGATLISMNLDFSTLTQVAGDSSVGLTSQNGSPVGTLESFTISQEGVITGAFTNGDTLALGQIATANFSNPSGLEKLGQSRFQSSTNSGLAQIGVAGSQGRGAINTGYVEMSNVDLSGEFTDLIVTQRGFQANTKIITTVDQLLQEVINIKQ
jgi:flagellar hook protein FlgE